MNKDSLEEFEALNRTYSSFTRDLLSKGKLPMRSTSLGFWSHANLNICKEIFERIGMLEGKRFLDLGSGDGRVVLLASLMGAKSEGIEIDSELVGTSLNISKDLNIPALFHCKDIHSHSLSSYNLLFLNPDAPLERGLERKILSELKGRLILYGNHFRPQFLYKKNSFEIDGVMVTLYDNPKNPPTLDQ